MLIDRAYVLAAMGKLDDALDDLALAQEVDPADDRLPNARAKVIYETLVAAKKLTEGGAAHRSLALMKKTLQLDPENADAYNARGFAYWALGERRLAWDDRLKANALDSVRYKLPEQIGDQSAP